MAIKGWHQTTLGDFVTLQRGHDLPDSERRSGTVPVIGSFGITGYHDTALAKGPGVTIGRSGASFGVVTYSPVDYWPHNACLYTKDFHGNDERFAYYYLKSIDFSSFNSGSAQPSLNRNFIYPIKIEIPDLLEQRAIAGLLGELDEKIEVNRRMNATLESIVRAVFREWFMESEEVKAWKTGKFDVISELSRGAITPNQFPDETFNHYSIPAFDEKQFPKKELGAEIMSNKFLVPNACILISKLNPETQRIWMPFRIEDRSICSTEFLVNTPKSYFSVEYLYGLFSSQPFQDRFTSMITGTSGSHQRVKAEYLLDMDTQIPPKKLVIEYTETVGPLLQKIQENILESCTLASLRNSLLPKLMKGEVRVKDL